MKFSEVDAKFFSARFAIELVMHLYILVTHLDLSLKTMCDIFGRSLVRLFNAFIIGILRFKAVMYLAFVCHYRSFQS